MLLGQFFLSLKRIIYLMLSSKMEKNYGQNTPINHAHSLEVIRQGIRHIVDLRPKPEQTIDQKIFRPNWNNEPEKIAPLLTLNDHSILTAGNIATLVAQTGSGKSHVCESILATAINSDADNLGIKATVEFGSKILYLDTERPAAETWAGWARTMYRAGFRRGEELPDNLIYESLINLLPDQRRERIETLIQTEKPKLVIMDGIIDLLPNGDFNSLAETTLTVAWLVRQANENNCGILCTIHANPTDGDTRPKGHTGTKLMEKSEFVIALEKLSDGSRRLSSEFRYGKNRSGAGAEIFFQWVSDCEHPGFYRSDKPSKAVVTQTNKEKKYKAYLVEILKDSLFGLCYTELHQQIVLQYKTSKTTAENIIKWGRETDFLCVDLEYYKIRESPELPQI